MDVFKTLILDTPDSLDNISGVLPIVNGGTGADNASDARDNLGLGTMSTQDANAVAITGGSATGLTSLSVNDDTTLGSSNSDTVTFNARIASEFTPATDNTYDLGRTGHEWRNLYLDGTANIDSLVADTADINGGTIDGTTIGATTPSTVAATSLSASTQVDFFGRLFGLDVSNETRLYAGSAGLSIYDHIGTGRILNLTQSSTKVGVVGTGDVATFTSTGLGIGLASPSQKLDVNGYAKATGLYFGGTNSLLYEAAADSVGLRVGSDGPYVEFVDAAGVLEFGNAGGSLYLTTVGTPRVYINTSGAVGVGTASPSTKLSVATATNGGISVNDGTVNGIIYGSGWATNSFAIGTTTNHPLVFVTNNAGPQMTLATSGYIGIGTSTPKTGLDLRGTSATTGSTLQVIGNGVSTLLLGQDADGGVIRGQGGGNALKFYTGGSGDSAANASGSEHMRITSAGNVGIGLTSPAAAGAGKSTLDVNGPVLARGGVSLNQTNAGGLDFNSNVLRIRSWGATAGTGSMSFRIGGGGGSLDSEAMRISQGGNVGINDASPSYKLDVNGTFRSTGALWNDDTINLKRNGAGYVRHRYIDQPLFLGVTNTAGTLYYPIELNPASDYVRFSREGGAETMRIDSSGRVGIGTSSPAYQLQLSTDSAAKPSTNTWTIASDARIKTETGEYTKGLDAVLSLRPVTYRYNGKAGMVDDGEDKISIIAQEAITAFPECVGSYMTKLEEDDEEETEVLNWNGHALTFALVNAIKELTARIESLENN